MAATMCPAMLPSVAKRVNIVSRRVDTTTVSEDSQKRFMGPGHKCCARGETSQHLGNMITSAMLPPQCVPVLPAPYPVISGVSHCLVFPKSARASYWCVLLLLQRGAGPTDGFSVSLQKPSRSARGSSRSCAPPTLPSGILCGTQSRSRYHTQTPEAALGPLRSLRASRNRALVSGHPTPFLELTPSLNLIRGRAGKHIPFALRFLQLAAPLLMGSRSRSTHPPPPTSPRDVLLLYFGPFAVVLEFLHW